MAVAYDKHAESHGGTTGSASEASFSWSHSPNGTPRGVLVLVYTFADQDLVSSVTYGGVSVPAVSGGEAVCTETEASRCRAFFLGSSIPTGTQTVVVNRTNNATVMYAHSFNVTAGGDTEVNTAGIVLQTTSGTLAEVNVDDGSPGTNSQRFAGITSGLGALTLIDPGANSTTFADLQIDIGARIAYAVWETTPGQGSRPVGFVSATTDERSAVYLAVREIAAPAGNHNSLLLLGVG